MNAYAKTKEEFIKFNNSRELFKQLIMFACSLKTQITGTTVTVEI